MDPIKEDVEISIAIMQKYVNQGYGREAIAIGTKMAKEMGYCRVIAYIRDDNIASIKAFLACGAYVTGEYELRKGETTEYKMLQFCLE